MWCGGEVLILRLAPWGQASTRPLFIIGKSRAVEGGEAQGTRAAHVRQDIFSDAPAL